MWAVVILLFLGFRYLFSLAPAAFALAKRFLGVHITELVGSCLVCGVGVCLFWLREHHATKYALTEFSFAFATAWTTIERASDVRDISTWLGLSGAAYLIVRGCDNLAKGLRRIRTADSQNMPNQAMQTCG